MSTFVHSQRRSHARSHTDAHSQGDIIAARWPIRLFVLTCLALAVSLIAAAGASAAPTNDDFASATAISSLPFTDTVDATSASTEPGEPQSCFFSDQTVWYAITPSQDGTLAADASGSTATAQVTAYRADASGLSGLSFLTCANFGDARAVFEVQAGQTYYLQASALFASAGSLRVNVKTVPAPPNDDFANAKAIASSPFSDSVDLTAATLQPGEPTTCQGSPSLATAWYAFTPSQSGSYALQRSDFGSLAAYTGASLSSLTQVACTFGQLFFHADAGSTYYLQVASFSGQGRPAQLTLDVAPAATASFVFFPGDPSIVDTVQFIDTSYDPAGIGSRTWTLKDGITTSECCPTRRYSADGDYTAHLAVTTTDGRTASISQVVPVRTHDVAITQLTVPKSARVGRTKQITVAVNNSRYPETVRVSMLRSVPGADFEEIGQVTQGVPARATRRTTTFSISYTFSADDATLGKVTFKVIATTLTARDAHPADNTAIAPPTSVTS
ncbi:MAG TPA: PKD domain-containing protein [Solirubrobacteraceae bacterium]